MALALHPNGSHAPWGIFGLVSHFLVVFERFVTVLPDDGVMNNNICPATFGYYEAVTSGVVEPSYFAPLCITHCCLFAHDKLLPEKTRTVTRKDTRPQILLSQEWLIISGFFRQCFFGTTSSERRRHTKYVKYIRDDLFLIK